MTKKRSGLFLIISMLMGLVLSACAGNSPNALTIKGDATNAASIKFEQLRTPFTAINITTQLTSEEEVLMTSQPEKVELIRTIEAVNTAYGHHCDGDSLIP